MSEPEQDKELDEAFAEFADKSEPHNDSELSETVGEAPQEQFQESETDELTRSRQEIETWKHKYNSDLGRQNALQRKIQEQAGQLAEMQSQKSQVHNETSSEWEAVKEDYPDIADAFDAKQNATNAKYERIINELKGEIAPIKQQAEQQSVDMQINQLTSAHQDWQEIVATSDYHEWLNTQPAQVQSMMSSQEASDNIFLLNTYKASMPSSSQNVQQRRQRQLQQAQTVPNRTSRAKTSAVAEDDYVAAFEFYSKNR